MEFMQICSVDYIAHMRQKKNAEKARCVSSVSVRV